MGWFSKKENVPELPPAPPAPRLPDLPVASGIPKNEELPSLPFSDLGRNLNQEMVKSAVSDPGEEEEVLPSFPQSHFEGSRSGLIPSIAQEEMEDKRRTFEIPEGKEKNIARQIGPIFVKITDFQKAQKDFKEITKEISHIERILAKFKDLKTKEDEQFAKWVQDLQKTKAKLSEIDSNIFSKI